MVVDRLRKRLHNVHSAIAHTGPKLDIHIVIAKTRDVSRIQWHTQMIGDLARKRQIGTSAKKTNFPRWNWYVCHSASLL